MAHGLETTGNLARTPLPDLLAEIHRAGAGGCLFLVRGATARAIDLEDGVPRWASGIGPAESFAAFLFRRGWIGLEAAGTTDGQPPAGSLDEARAAALQREHALELLLDLFAWDEGTYLLVERQGGAPAGSLECSLAALLALGMPRVSRLDALVAGAGHAPLVACADAGIDLLRELPDDACRVLGAVRSATSPSPADETWPPDARVLESLWLLRLLGLVGPAAPGEGIEPSNLIGDRLARTSASVESFETMVGVEGLLLAGRPPRAPSREPSHEAKPLPAAVPSPVAAVPPVAVPPVAMPAPAAAMPPIAATPAVQAAPATSGPAAGASGPEPVRPSTIPPMGSDTLAAISAVSRLDEFELPAPTERTPTSREDAAADWFKSGERFLRQLDLHSAITSFREAVQLCPENALYLYKLGATLQKNPKWRKEAEECLVQAAEIRPWDARIQVGLARLYSEAGLYRRAEARLKAALEADPVNAAAQNEMKELQQKMGGKGGKAPASGGGLFGRLVRRRRTAPAESEKAFVEEGELVEG